MPVHVVTSESYPLTLCGKDMNKVSYWFGRVQIGGIDCNKCAEAHDKTTKE